MGNCVLKRTLAIKYRKEDLLITDGEPVRTTQQVCHEPVMLSVHYAFCVCNEVTKFGKHWIKCLSRFYCLELAKTSLTLHASFVFLLTSLFL